MFMSCSKNTIDNVNVNVNKQSTYNINHLSFVVNADYEGDFGVNYEDFVVEIIVTATALNKPTLTQIITLTQDNFIACQSKMVHGLGYKFDAVTYADQQLDYLITHTKTIK